MWWVVNGLVALGMAATMIGGCLTSGCTPQEQQLAAKSLHLGADMCRLLAQQALRPDVELACIVAHDGSEVLELALQPPVLDAGGQ
jgi:hypothetical protein